VRISKAAPVLASRMDTAKRILVDFMA